MTINFDGLTDSTDVGSFYHAADGVDFQSDITLTAGKSVNQVDFPPHSGTGVIADNGDPLVISFVNPANSISAYFAYNTQLTFSAYDHSGALIGTTYSTGDSHGASWLGKNNNGTDQLISLGFSGVSTLDIFGADDFIMDDLTFTTSAIPNGGSAPERDSTLALLLIASLAMALFSRTKSPWPVSS